MSYLILCGGNHLLFPITLMMEKIGGEWQCGVFMTNSGDDLSLSTNH